MLKKRSIFSRYVHHVRRSPQHLQQVHALVFAGGITVLLASSILYFDYGFWNDRYNSNDIITEEEKIEAGSKSPFKMFSQFTEEVSTKMVTLKSGGNALLERKESYSKKEEFLRSTTTIEVR